jgi:hypothetical protein
MKPIPRLMRLEHTNGRRQHIIQHPHQIFRWNRRFSCETCHLSQGVHTCIGPTRTLWQYFFRGNPSNSRGQCALDGGSIRLYLPPGEFRAIIGEYQLDIAHDSWSRLRRTGHQTSLQSFTNIYPKASASAPAKTFASDILFHPFAGFA